MNNVIIEGAEIFFKNFSGAEKPYNEAGKRNFCVKIDEDLAQKLKADKWNVKYTKPRDEDDDPEPYIQVNVSYRKKKPKIVIIKGNNSIKYNEEDIDALDWMRFDNADIKINGSPWNMGDNSGVKAYLESLYITIEEDELDKKYAYIGEETEEVPFE